MAALPIKIGEVERQVRIISALAYERQGLGCVDLLAALVEAGAGEVVLCLLVDAHRNRLHDLGDLIEGHEGDLDEVVDRHFSEELGHGRDLRLASSVAFHLLPLRAVQPGLTGKPAGRLVEGQPVRLLDLADTLTVRAAGQVHVVVTGNGDLGGLAAVAGHMQQHQHVGVEPAVLLVTGVERVVDLFG